MKTADEALFDVVQVISHGSLVGISVGRSGDPAPTGFVAMDADEADELAETLVAAAKLVRENPAPVRDPHSSARRAQQRRRRRR